MRAIGLQGLRSAARDARGFALVCSLLALFVLQSAIARGHFHLAASTNGVAAIVADASADLGGTQQPRPAHNESKCLLWHASSICGSAVTADAGVFFAPPDARLRVALDERLIFPERFAAAWRIRAPPAV